MTRPCTRLERLDHKLIVPFAIHYLCGSLGNGIRQLLRAEALAPLVSLSFSNATSGVSVHISLIEQSQLIIHKCCRTFHCCNGPDERAPRTQSADLKIFHRTLSLRAIKSRSGNLYFTQGIFFKAKFF